ncbi:MAG: hypothetical protein QG639_293 [Patescibacteria group bacterium]|nr:hypothetical protein [Patescibacteria group bacterium]
MTSVHRLFSDDSTLYGEPPGRIAAMLEHELNQFSSNNYQVVSVVAVPDFHHFARDGGVKDILFLAIHSDLPQKKWHVTLLRDDHWTMHGIRASVMRAEIERKIRSLEQKGYTVKHLVMLTDHHNFTAGAQGMGGRDGVKNILICYQ